MDATTNFSVAKGQVRRAMILTYLKNYQQAHGFSPNYREIAAGVGVRSLETIHRQLDRLQRDGLIVHEPALSRAIRVLG